MNRKLFFYVCDSEYSRDPKNQKYNCFKDESSSNCIVEDTREGVRFKYCEGDFKDMENKIRVIVVNGKQLDSKNKAVKHYLSELSVRVKFLILYFEELEKIAERTFAKYISDWRPDSVIVITHWGKSPVEKKEAAFAEAVEQIQISDERFKSWKTISSSSIRSKVFPSKFNPFLSYNEEPACLPNGDTCECLEQRLPSASEIKWGELATASEDELKEYYNRLMRKLNH